MGHSIPVFFCTVPGEITYPPGTPWFEAQDLIGDRLPTLVWQDTSRNWWHIYLTLRIATALSISGLEFLEHECVTLALESLAESNTAIEHVIASVAKGTPVPSLAGDYDYELVACPANRSAISLAAPTKDNYDQDASGIQGATGYFSFLRSLQAAMREAVEARGNFLFVQPQP